MGRVEDPSGLILIILLEREAFKQLTIQIPLKTKKTWEIREPVCFSLQNRQATPAACCSFWLIQHIPKHRRE